MSVPTASLPTSAPVFPERDSRDPAVLGWALLTLSDGRAPLSEVYDRFRWQLERVPSWEGDGLMSNDPSKHHTNQTPAPEGSA